MTMIDNTSDERLSNNTFRHQYRPLSDEEKLQMQQLKDLGVEFLTVLDRIRVQKPGITRELALAKTNMEQAVMWGVKGLTA